MPRLAAALPLTLMLTLTTQVAAAEEQGTFDAVDKAFGKYLVAPMAGVMFWDIAFWDNELPAGEGIGTVVDGAEVTGHDAAKGYAYQKRMEAPKAGLFEQLEAPKKQKLGQLEVELTTSKDGVKGKVPAGPIEADPAKLIAIGDWNGAPLGELPPPAEGLTRFVLEGAAPFPIAVDRAEDGTTTVVPMDRTLEASLLPPRPGAKVLFEGALAEVVAIEGDTAKLRATEKTWKPGKLPNPNGLSMPLVVAWLVFGAVYFTLRMSFINLRGFAHAIRVTAGQYDHEGDTGEISHFKALSSALSATVGLGNIAGVAIAVGVGGPGAIFWMVLAGFLGMSSKFTECTLGQMYRQVDDSGRVMGGPMRYLGDGLAELGMSGLGKALALIFAVMCIGGSLGGGNMFQANQSYAAVSELVPAIPDYGYGIVLAILVGAVILGGIKRIGSAAGFIVPVMCGVYVLAGLFILIDNASEVPHALGVIFSEAFTPEAGRGGLIGVLVQGFRRAAFSNEAGIGSASIAHSAASTEEPVREGIVALLEPFIDTIIVCTMTGLVVVITGTYKTHAGDGVLMTSAAFGQHIEWFPAILSFAVVMFAFSTMISWSYYGERSAVFLFGARASTPYKLLFLVFVFFGSVFKLGNVLDFSDLMVLGMAFPNILGLLLLSGKVKERLDDYWGRYTSGAMPRTK